LAADRTAAEKPAPLAIPPVAIVIALVLAVGLGGFAYLNYRVRQPAPPPPPLTGDAKNYLKHLRFVAADGQTPESPKMEAHESYMKQSVVEITGNIQNQGDRVLELIEINCVFYDPYGQIVLRERVPVVSKKMGKLSPGEFKSFRLAFDNVPGSWNQAMPTMVIARIDFT
jgi:hypothetical protein